MVEVDLDRDKQQANEELKNILMELVIDPVGELIEEHLRSQLFRLGSDFEDEIKKQVSPLSKTRAVRDSFSVQEGCFDDLSKDVLNEIGVVSKEVNQAFEKVDHRVSNLQGSLASSEQSQMSRDVTFKSIFQGVNSSLVLITERIDGLESKVDSGVTKLIEQNKLQASRLDALVQSQSERMVVQEKSMNGLKKSLQRLFWVTGGLGLFLVLMLTLQLYYQYFDL